MAPAIPTSSTPQTPAVTPSATPDVSTSSAQSTSATGTAVQPGATPTNPTQPGTEMPEQKKSKGWLWAVLGIGVLILVGLLVYFVFL